MQFPLYDQWTGYSAGERCSTRELPVELIATIPLGDIRLMLDYVESEPESLPSAQRVSRRP